MGHVRDLPEHCLCVDVKNDFKPKYEVIKGKEKLVSELEEKAEKSDYVYLATDPDREGEAISWHLAYLLHLDLADQNRVTFNEITKTGVANGMEHPREIDLDLVNAQQARRILDRLVGYKLSPFLSQKIRRGSRPDASSRWPCASSSTARRKSAPSSRRSTGASTQKLIPKGSRKAFPAAFYGDEKGKIKIENEAQANEILNAVKGGGFRRHWSRKAPGANRPPAVYHLHPAAGGFQKARLPGAAHHEGRAGAV